MSGTTSSAPLGNPYRQPKPRKPIAGGKFYLANQKGSYGANTSPVFLALCPEYLWVSDTLSIPLASITEIGLTKHGGCIFFWDSIAGASMEFNFTKLGFLRFKRKKVVSFLEIVSAHLPVESQESGFTPDSSVEHGDSVVCEACGTEKISVLVYYVF